MKQKVLIYRCENYEPASIAAIVKEGMQELGVTPRGKILLKPNCVIAHEVFPHAYTRAEFIDGVIRALKERAGDGIEEILVGERSGITVPTRFSYKNARYEEVLSRNHAKPCYFDEEKQISVKLSNPYRLRDSMFIPKPVTQCDCFINLPKFKAHPWTRLTLSLKNLIGIQDDRHRLVDHNSFLEHKIADLQETIQTDFIAVDAIVAGQKMMLTPTPFPMGAIIMGINPCAVDTICSHMVNVDPNTIVHLRLAAERGFGPIDMELIDIGGDLPLREVQDRNRGFEFCMEHIDSYFKDTGNLSCTVGTFPESHSADYCWGGCPGALQEAIHIFKMYYPDVLQRMRKVRYVVGQVEGPLDLAPDERVIFAGDCTRWEGTLDGKHVKIEGKYRSTKEVDENRTPSNDMLLKIFGSLLECYANTSSRYIHAKGCPVSVAAHVNYLSSIGRIPNVNFDPRNLIPINVAYWNMRFHRFMNRFL